MVLSKAVVLGLSIVLDDSHFFTVRIAGHMHYGKDLEHVPAEARLLETEHHGPFYHLKRDIAKAGLYLAARYTKDEEAREMARNELKR